MQALKKTPNSRIETNELADIIVDFRVGAKFTEEKREAYYYNSYVQLLGYLALSLNGEKSRRMTFLGKSPVASLRILEKQELVQYDCLGLGRWHLSDTGKELCEWLDN